jgi:hypothetical protein
VDAELRQDVLRVRAQRVPAHAQSLGDLLGRQALRHGLEDLELPRRQPLDASLELGVLLRARTHRADRAVDLGRAVDRLAPVGTPDRVDDVDDGSGLAQEAARADLDRASQGDVVALPGEDDHGAA